MAHQGWCVSPSDLVNLGPVRARDLIVQCFFEAQKETFARQRKQLGLSDEEAKLRSTVVGAVRAVFKEVGLDFEHPTAAGLQKVVGVLGARAASWGTPEDIIEHHRGQLGQLLQAVKD